MAIKNTKTKATKKGVTKSKPAKKLASTKKAAPVKKTIKSATKKILPSKKMATPPKKTAKKSKIVSTKKITTKSKTATKSTAIVVNKNKKSLAKKTKTASPTTQKKPMSKPKHKANTTVKPSNLKTKKTMQAKPPQKTKKTQKITRTPKTAQSIKEQKIAKITSIKKITPAKKVEAKASTTKIKQEVKSIKKMPTTPKNKDHIVSFVAKGAHHILPYAVKHKEEYMNDTQRKHIKSILMSLHQALKEEVDRTISHLQEEAANFPDLSDRASQEENFGLELRTRDRERLLLKKIEDALERVRHEDFGYCEVCGIEIGLRRLEARPTATLCIDCKEIAEVKEKQESGG